ncbi:kinesin-related protein 4-like [Mercenaria mercenaria]|uniref:kinesin-related protein 4-like n=1 Tax=Mercenaria mercenaria TaxID=6596 RepID=UPI00234E7BC5|nr:kinesin-related protein 4-like [Mercenaria mercenaria]
MGCSNSTPVHPSIYNETIKKQNNANGEIKEKAPIQEVNTKYMKGDFSQYQLAKHNREKHQKERQIKLFQAADEMTGKVMEDREMLSLGTRSRGTSRNTSRATSPTSNKRNQQQKEDHMVPMTPVAEDKLSRGTSLKSIDTTPKKKHKKDKQSKNKSKTKKHRKGKKSKKGKGKSSEEKHDSDSDSGLEDENEDHEEHSDAENDKENDEVKTVINVTQNENAHNTTEHLSSNTNIKHEGVLPLKDANSAMSVETPLVSKRSVRDIKIQSASKDSGIAESGINEITNQSTETTGTDLEDNNRNDGPAEERSDSRI